VRAGQTVLVAVLLLAGTWLLGMAAFDDPTHVDVVRIDNPTEYDINVAVRPIDSPGQLLVGRAVQRCTTPFHLVVDQGSTWVFRFGAQGRDGGEVAVDRAQLERDGWTLQVPQEVIDTLRDSGAPPPPNQRCAAE